jgi:1-acyl-sn-glycerol-3-phosphate acyltransferase
MEYATCVLDKDGWTAVGFLPMSNVTRLQNSILKSGLIAAGLGILVGLVISIAFSRRMTSQISALAQSMLKVKKGDLNVGIKVQGKELIPKKGRFLLVCNHLHEADPIVLLWTFRKSQLAFISKRENDSRFLIGPFLRALLCQPINRENDREALKTILKCIQLIKEDTVSIAVFPEGYTSMDRLLHPFRSGVFKIAQKADVPIVVCTLRNTYDIYHNIKHGKGMEVEVHITGVIPAEDLKGRTAVDVANQAHEMMANDLGPALVFSQEENTENA